MKKALWGVLIVAPLAAVIGAFAPGTEGYKTSCACISARQGFAMMAGIRERAPSFALISTSRTRSTAAATP